MWLDLREIIEMPGKSVDFECTLSTELLNFPSVVRFITEPKAKGTVLNTAGVLTLTGVIDAKMLCVCDRCGREFETDKHVELNVPLAADMEDDEDPDIFPLDGDGIELDEVLETCFILDMEAKFLCREDCKGLCHTCGKDLNEGECSCGKQVDPRLAVLGQLLDIED